MKQGSIYQPLLTALPKKETRSNLLWLPGLLLTILICGLVSGTKAQNVWNRTFVEDRPSMRFSSVVYADSAFHVVGVTVNMQQPNIEQGLFLKYLQPSGVVSYVAIPDSTNVITGLFWNTLIKTAENNYAFAGAGGDTAQHLVFGFMNGGFDSAKVFRYKTPNTYAFQGLTLIEKNNYYYVSGVHNYNPGFNANVALLKIDSVGNLLWEKYYDQRKMDYSQSMIGISNGNILLGSFRNDLNQTNEKSNTWLLEVDTGGNIVRQWFDPNDSTYVAEGLRQTQDGGFIYGAQKRVYQVAGSLGFTATVVKMDSNFNKQWVYEGGVLGTYTGVVDIEPLIDGGYVACGNYSNKEAWVIRFTEAGQVVWLRKYMGLSDTTVTWNLLSDIDVMPDGGFVAVGQCQRIVNPNNLTPQVGWFLKLDSNGCEVENCLVGIEDQPQPPKGALNGQIRIQPNPASDRVWVEVEPGLLGGNLKIYDVSGHLVKQLLVEALQLVVDVSELSKGVYGMAVEHQGLLGRRRLVKE